MILKELLEEDDKTNKNASSNGKKKKSLKNKRKKFYKKWKNFKKFFLCSIINVGIMIKRLKKMMNLTFKLFHLINFHHKSNNTINIVMRIVRSEKENTNYLINYSHSLCWWFWFLRQ